MAAVHQLVYVSAARSELEEDRLLGLLREAREANARAGLTGLLLYSDGAFMQLLEGDEAAVRATFDRVSGDRRHHRVTVLLRRDADRRAFGDWSMGFRRARAAELAGVDGLSTFLDDASQPSGDLALRMLYGFRAVA